MNLTDYSIPEWFHVDEWSFVREDQVNGFVQYEIEEYNSSLCDEGDHYYVQFYQDHFKLFYGHANDYGYREIPADQLGQMKPVLGK